MLNINTYTPEYKVIMSVFLVNLEKRGYTIIRQGWQSILCVSRNGTLLTIFFNEDKECSLFWDFDEESSSPRKNQNNLSIQEVLNFINTY